MRQFLPEEKKIMDYICGLEILSADIAISNIIEKFTDCTLVWDESALSLSFNEEIISEADALNSVLTLVCLLDYLKSESLIYVFAMTNLSERHEIINKRIGHVKDGELIAEERSIPLEKGFQFSINGKTYTLGDSATGITLLSKTNIPWDVVEMVDKYAKSVLFCTETLRHLKSQNYKDDATIQYEENREQTWKAIWISLSVGIGSMFVSGFFGLLTYFQSEAHHRENLSKPKEYIEVHDIIRQPIKPIISDIIPISNDSLKTALSTPK